MSARLRAGAIDAAVAVAAAFGSFLSVYLVAAKIGLDPSAAIMAAAIALTLGRKPAKTREREHDVVEWIGLPIVGLFAAGIGHAFRSSPWLGAAMYVAGMFLSVWLRQFGERWRRAGAALALPLVAILITPAPRVPGKPLAGIALALASGIVALVWVRALQSIAGLGGVKKTDANAQPAATAAGTARKGLSTTTRFAVQMAAGLAAAFVFGFALLERHWSWAVLTAFIVASGNHGRGDVLYKSTLRFAGAVAGTLAAALVGLLPPIGGPFEVAAIFAALFIGLWLREINYAYWALTITLVVAVLQRDGGNAVALLGTRLEGIVLGAICGIAAAWFVLPVRTHSVVFRRLADALRALDELLRTRAPVERAAKARDLAELVAKLERIAPPLRVHRFTLGKNDPDHAALWIADMHRASASAAGYRGDTSVALRAVGDARRALKRRVRPDEPATDRPADDRTLADAMETLSRVLNP